MRKLNARADRIFLLKVAFFHMREHKNFRPVAFLKKMGIANPPIVMGKIRFGCKVRFWGGVMPGLCLG